MKERDYMCLLVECCLCRVGSHVWICVCSWGRSVRACISGCVRACVILCRCFLYVFVIAECISEHAWVGRGWVRTRVLLNASDACLHAWRHTH